MAKFNSMTFNCNGIGEKKKRQKVFTYLKDKLKNGFCFLQETHSTQIQESKWKSQWNGNIYFSHGSSNSTGCAIAFTDKFPVKIVKQSKDTEGRLLILETIIDDDKFLLINLYNANTESEQVKVLDSLASMLQEHNIDGDCKPIFGGDFNLYFDTILDCSGGNPCLKKRSITKLMKIVDKLDVSDIFRVRYPHLKRFTFHRRNPVIHRRLDFIFTSNSMQEFVENVDILPSFMSDHSPVFISVNLNSKIERGSYSWKFNNSLLKDNKFVSDIRKHFDCVKRDLANSENPHLKWELFKYEARKFSIAFSKLKNKQENNLKNHHENIVKMYQATQNRPTENEYAESNAYLESYYEKKTQGAILRSKSQFYEQNEKSTKYFLNLEKKIGEKNTVKKLVKGNVELSNSKDILEELHAFYSNLFDRKINKTKSDCKTFLDTLQLPVISDEHKQNCDKILTIEDLENSLFKMSDGKSPGNDGLTVEFYKFFWEDIKTFCLIPSDTLDMWANYLRPKDKLSSSS